LTRKSGKSSLWGVNDQDGRAADVLAEEMVVVVNSPVADQRHVVVPHQRAQPVQVGEHAGTASGCQRQVQRCGFTVRLVIWMLEVGVTV
jgi:hypothetical protein